LEFHGNKTNQQKVFVAGDLINKNKTVIHAIRSGKEAAKEIDDFLTGKSNIPEGVTKI
jgi:glutamate synthase (NADPH/NADH) small chain